MRVTWSEFRYWRDGVRHALAGGVWLHRFTLGGERWAHLVSANREALLEAGGVLALAPQWLQFRPLKHPETGERLPAWHWDLRGERLQRAIALAARAPVQSRLPS